VDILDANIFIEARKRYYAFDICPGYWGALLHHHGSGALCSLDRIRDELTDKNDELSQWANGTAPAAFFHGSQDPAVIAQYGEIMAWVQAQAQFMDAAKADFASGADGWLIAYAAVHGHRVVTEEVLDANIRKKVPIPNVCAAFGVDYGNTWEMLRTHQIQFGWAPPPATAAAGVAASPPAPPGAAAGAPPAAPLS